jgi:prepilin-type N-terminal cleavage/methylation domain-containing protein/prepilin-type processing-associated H-X9-DG protein
MTGVKKHNGFTLIELLVVIAIIAILAAILFPVFAKAREKARQATCQSNEKQLGLAVLQYVQDYDEYWPSGGNGPHGGFGCGAGWAGDIYPYVKSLGSYTCPDDSNQASTGNVVLSYGYNQNLSAFPNNNFPQTQSTNNSAALQSPASTVVLVEMGQQTDSYNEITGTNNTTDADSCATDGSQGWSCGKLDTGPMAGDWQSNNGVGLDSVFITGRHTNGSNYLLADGHVKWLFGGKVSTGGDALTPTSTTTGNGGNGRADGTGLMGTGSLVATFSAI